MFIVYRIVTDGCTYSDEVWLFVTDTEDKARDFVALAELELEEARKIEYPSHTIKDIEKLGVEAIMAKKQEYSDKINAMFTVDKGLVEAAHYFPPEAAEYSYCKVEVR